MCTHKVNLKDFKNLKVRVGKFIMRVITRGNPGTNRVKNLTKLL